jgi:hypothetical protein
LAPPQPTYKTGLSVTLLVMVTMPTTNTKTKITSVTTVLPPTPLKYAWHKHKILMVKRQA